MMRDSIADTVSDTRRALVFNDLAEVLQDVERMRTEHRTIGNWSLAQICKHLADSFNGSIDGFGVDRHWLMRTVVGRSALRRVFQTNSLDTGFTVTERLNPSPDVELDPSITDLSNALDRFTAHTGPLHLHPFFGELDHDEWRRLHCIHCAHHLSFVLPA